MKSIKILMAIILVLVFTAASVSAEIDYPGAEKLKEFGFIQGYKGDLMVNKALTRAEACVLLAELYGEKTKASEFTRKSSFKDVAEKDWFAPYVNYAQHKGWIDGYPSGNFGPGDYITVQAWAKLMLTVLDRYESWGTAVSDLKKVGVRIYAVDANKMKRGEAFDTMWAVVNQPVKGEQVSLGVKLGKLKSKEAQIVGMETPSLKLLEIKVSDKLNKESAENVKNYLFLDADGKKLSVKTALYDAEADRISIVFENLLKENTELMLSEIGVLTEHEGNLLAGEYGSYRIRDSRAPQIIDVKALGTKAVKVYFSEPVVGKEGELSKTSDFIFDKQLSVKRIFLTDEDMAAVIEFHTTTSGSLSIYPQKSIRDYAGFALISDEKKYTVEMKPDLTVPSIESVVKVSPVELVVKLNKNMTLSNRGSEGFAVGNRKADSGAQISGDMLYLTFQTNYLPVGKSEFVIRKGALNDYSGISNGEMKKEIEIPADNEMPFSEGVTVVKQNQIKIRYNEPLKRNGTKLLSKSNYKLYQGDEDVSKYISTVNYESSEFTVVLNLNKDLYGNYRLEVKELLDLSGNDGASYYDFEVGDVTAPNPGKWNARLYNAGAANQFIVIRFDEVMNVEGGTSVLSASNYMYGDTAFDRLDPDKLKMTLAGNGEMVEIHYPGKRHGGMDFESGGTKKLSIARVADIAGNKVDGFVNTLSLERNSTMSIDKAYLVDYNVIVFEVRDEIYEFDERDVIFEAGGKILKGKYDEISVKDGITTFRYILETVPTHSITVKTKAGGSRSPYGDMFKNSSPLVVSDKVGPKLLDEENITYHRNTRTIALLFNEELNSKVVSLLSFEIPGVRIEEINVYKNEIRILIAKEDRDNITVDSSVIQLLELRDLDGNSTEGIVARVNKIK